MKLHFLVLGLLLCATAAKYPGAKIGVDLQAVTEVKNQFADELL